MFSTIQTGRNGMSCSRQRYGVMAVMFGMAVATVAIGVCGPSLSARAASPGQDAVRYRDFGAKGDGKTDDIDAIVKAHAFANEHGLPVKADDEATYFISGKNRTAVIQTDTDFGTAAFVIDDTDVQDRRAHVFLVSSNLQPFQLKGVSSLKRNQEKSTSRCPEPVWSP
jgi:hypothetical protein